jgi:hypothetical protein
MSDSQPSKVFMFDPNDPEMEEAFNLARATFKQGDSARFRLREITDWMYVILGGKRTDCGSPPHTRRRSQRNDQQRCDPNEARQGAWLGQGRRPLGCERGDQIAGPNSSE